MKTGKPEPFTLLGTTSSINKDATGPVALSPTRSWVADSGRIGGEYVVRITDYSTGNTVRRIGGLAEPPTVLAFSPNGQDLLICTRSGDFVSSQRWTNCFWTWHATFLNAAAWLDNYTVILACYWSSDGIPRVVVKNFYQPSESATRAFPLQWTAYGGYVRAASCTPSGLIVAADRESDRIRLYQLGSNRMSATEVARFSPGGTGPWIPCAVDDAGGYVLLAQQTRDECRLYSRSGIFCGTLPGPAQSAALRHGSLAVLKDVRWRGYELHLYRITDDNARPWCVLNGETNARSCDVQLLNGETIVAVEEEDRTRVFKVVDSDLLRLWDDEPTTLPLCSRQ